MFRVDEQQLRRLLDTIRSPSATLQNAKVIVEVLALLGAAAWAMLTYPWFANQVAVEQLKAKLEKKIKVEAKITIHNLGAIDQERRAYDITYSRDIINLSIKDVAIEVCSLEWFIGEPAKGAQSFRANMPGKAGPIAWKSLGIEVHREQEFDAHKLGDLLSRNANASREVLVLEDAEGGVGRYGPEERSTEFQTVHVVGTPNQWVGFVLLIGLRTDEELEQYYDYRHVHLAMANRSSGEKPQEIQ
jgi:hypothetical protein